MHVCACTCVCVGVGGWGWGGVSNLLFYAQSTITVISGLGGGGEEGACVSVMRVYGYALSCFLF